MKWALKYPQKVTKIKIKMREKLKSIKIKYQYMINRGLEGKKKSKIFEELLIKISPQ